MPLCYFSDLIKFAFNTIHTRLFIHYYFGFLEEFSIIDWNIILILIIQLKHERLISNIYRVPPCWSFYWKPVTSRHASLFLHKLLSLTTKTQFIRTVKVLNSSFIDFGKTEPYCTLKDLMKSPVSLCLFSACILLISTGSSQNKWVHGLNEFMELSDLFYS